MVEVRLAAAQDAHWLVVGCAADVGGCGLDGDAYVEIVKVVASLGSCCRSELHVDSCEVGAGAWDLDGYADGE